MVMTDVSAPRRSAVLLPSDAGASFGAPPSSIEDELLTPIDRYLRDQQQLTAVERFSQRHDAAERRGADGIDVLPEQARYYRDLIPLARPQAGQQYAFEVDL